MTKQRIRNILSAIFLITALVCAGYLAYHYWEGYVAQTKFDELKGLDYDKLRKKYPSMCGWIKIKHTNIDYPVMKTPKNNPEYWLRRNVDGDYSIAGTLFADPNSDVDKSFNVIIYGHHMMGVGSKDLMFGKLQDIYESKSGLKKHRYVKYTKWFHDGSYSVGKYRVFSAFRCSIKDKRSYLDYANITTRKTFDKYIDYCKDMSWFSSKTKPSYGDEIVTLSTCSYHLPNKVGRFVVVAVKDNTK